MGGEDALVSGTAASWQAKKRGDSSSSLRKLLRGRSLSFSALMHQVSAKARWLAKRARSDYYGSAPRADGGGSGTAASADDGCKAESGSTHADEEVSPAGGELLDAALTFGAEAENPLASEDEEVTRWWRGQARFNVDD